MGTRGKATKGQRDKARRNRENVDSLTLRRFFPKYRGMDKFREETHPSP